MPSFAVTRLFAKTDIHRKTGHCLRFGHEGVCGHVHHARFKVVGVLQRSLQEGGQLTVRIWHRDGARNTTTGLICGHGAKGKVTTQGIRALRVSWQGIAMLQLCQGIHGEHHIGFNLTLDVVNLRGEIGGLNALGVNLEGAQRQIKALLRD